MAKELTTFEEDWDHSLMISVLMVMGMVMLSSVMSSTIAPLTRQLQAQAYTGAVDSRELNATSSVKWINLIGDPPYNAWVSADFTNKGPGKAYVGVNTPGPWIEMESGGGGSVNMAGANKRIEVIFYKTDPGETAVITAIGKY